jgi:uncharacterized surface protein with fasciclin (FAS1) repeats
LKSVLAYHVVAGNLMQQQYGHYKNNGKYTVTTVQGGTIVLSKDGKVMLRNGGTATVILADVAASNGVIHAIIQL